MKTIQSHVTMMSLLLLLSMQSSFSTDMTLSCSQEVISSDQSDNQQEFTSMELEKMRILQEDFFDGIKKQSDAILISLQQIEQVLLANKIKFDETKFSKKELLVEIKRIKATMESIYSDCESLPTGDKIKIYAQLNKGFTDYLLICMQKDVTMFHGAKFQAFITDMFNADSEWNQNLANMTIQDILTINEKQALELIDATENFGLTDFNKAFRYFQEKPMSLTGKPLMSTCKDVAFYGTMAAVAYGLLYYNLPDTYKDSLPGSKLIGENLIGSSIVTRQAMTNPNPANVQAALAEPGIVKNIDILAQSCGLAIIPGALNWLSSNTAPIYENAVASSQVAYTKMISYLRGDVDKTTSSIFESETKKVYFSDMIGSEHLEKRARELADFIKHPKRYENSGIIPEKGLLLTGPPGTGKSFFANALRTLISEECGDNGEEVKFLYVKMKDVYRTGLDRIFAYARENAPFILFFDEIDTLGIHREKDNYTTNDLLTNMDGLNDNGKKVIVIGATNRPNELDEALLRDGRFGDKIRFEYPTYENRKQHLTQTLKKRNISSLSPQAIDAIAQETEGTMYTTLDKIVKNAIKTSMQQCRPVTARDFEESLDFDFRCIRTNIAMNNQEKEVVAIYHAGQAAARYILSTLQQVVKITIHAIEKPVKTKNGHSIETGSNGDKGQNIDLIKNDIIKSYKLGNVFTVSTSNNPELISDKDTELNNLALLAGQAALELIKGQCYNNFGKEDRAEVLHTLEQNISQLGPINDTIRLQALAKKDVLAAKIKEILTPHIQLIKMTADALLQHNTIDKNQWAAILTNYTA